MANSVTSLRNSTHIIGQSCVITLLSNNLAFRRTSTSGLHFLLNFPCRRRKRSVFSDNWAKSCIFVAVFSLAFIAACFKVTNKGPQRPWKPSRYIYRANWWLSESYWSTSKQGSSGFNVRHVCLFFYYYLQRYRASRQAVTRVEFKLVARQVVASVVLRAAKTKFVAESRTCSSLLCATSWCCLNLQHYFAARQVGHKSGNIACVAGRRKEGKSKWAQSSRVRSSCALRAHLYPFPLLRTPATQACGNTDNRMWNINLLSKGSCRKHWFTRLFDMLVSWGWLREI